MGQKRALGTMADPAELVEAMRVLGVVDRGFTAREATAAARGAGGQELWRLGLAHALAGAAEQQVLMAASAAIDAGADSTALLQAGWELFAGADLADDDQARVALLQVLATRLADAVMLLVARWRRGDGEVPQLVAPALVVATALQSLLGSALTSPAPAPPACARWPVNCAAWPRSSRTSAPPKHGTQRCVPTTMPTTDPTLVLELALKGLRTATCGPLGLDQGIGRTRGPGSREPPAPGA